MHGERQTRRFCSAPTSWSSVMFHQQPRPGSGEAGDLDGEPDPSDGGALGRGGEPARRADHRGPLRAPGSRRLLPLHPHAREPHVQGLRALEVPGLAEQLVAFWACVLRGVVPVMVAMPPAHSLREHAVVRKLINAAQLLDAAVAGGRGFGAKCRRSLAKEQTGAN